MFGFSSYEEALNAGKAHIDQYDSEFVEKIGMFDVSVRRWKDYWVYSVLVDGLGVYNQGNYKTKEEAVSAGRLKAEEMVKQLKEDIEKLT